MSDRLCWIEIFRSCMRLAVCVSPLIPAEVTLRTPDPQEETQFASPPPRQRCCVSLILHTDQPRQWTADWALHTYRGVSKPNTSPSSSQPSISHWNNSLKSVMSWSYIKMENTRIHSFSVYFNVSFNQQSRPNSQSDATILQWGPCRCYSPEPREVHRTPAAKINQH